MSSCSSCHHEEFCWATEQGCTVMAQAAAGCNRVHGMQQRLKHQAMTEDTGAAGQRMSQILVMHAKNAPSQNNGREPHLDTNFA